jgi:hypothetical protein
LYRLRDSHIMEVNMGKPFHKLTPEEYDELVESGMTYEELAKQHPQPEWCAYPGATLGWMGCWSLVSFQVTDPKFCKGHCDCYRKVPDA